MGSVIFPGLVYGGLRRWVNGGTAAGSDRTPSYEPDPLLASIAGDLIRLLVAPLASVPLRPRVDAP